MFELSGPIKTVLFEGLQEKDVGITEFTTSVPGMSGILKHRLIERKHNFISVLILLLLI